MKHRRIQKVLALLIMLWAVAASAAAQDGLDYRSREAAKREVTQLLLNNDVGDVANKLARTHETLVAPLLRQLMIFARAGHRTAVRQTLERLAAAPDMPPVSQRYAVADEIRQIVGFDDLASMKTFYERIMPGDARGGEYFIRLSEKEGDTKWLDSWLAERSKQNIEWTRWRIFRRMKLGTADELLNSLAEEVKANPTDRIRLQIYLDANRIAGGPQKNVSWLADFLKPQTAVETYELALLLKMDSPGGAAKLLEQSLSKKFTDADMTIIRDRVIPGYQIAPPVRNWEKQLRFWTKTQLADLYKSLGKASAAQVIIEELVADKDDDIVREDIYTLAGAVQSASGMRVVEAGILQNEAASQDSPSYWAERARYYIGRNEIDVAMNTYRTALARLPFRPEDQQSLAARLALLKEFTDFAASRDSSAPKSDERRAEIQQILWREFNSVPLENSYALGVALIISDDDYEFDAMTDSLFLSQPGVLARLLSPRTTWTNVEQDLIDNVVCRSGLTPEQRTAYWNQLEPLTRSGAPTRAYYLADTMTSCQSADRAVPLLTRYREYAKTLNEESNDPSEWLTVDRLFSAYLYSDNWQAAEKLAMDNRSLRPNQLLFDLGQISQTAARLGAFDDAVRLWRKKSNLDRRHLDGLEKLAATPAKEPLRRYYEEMKKRDPKSAIPAVALSILK